MKYVLKFKKMLQLTIIIFFLALPLWNLPVFYDVQEITVNVSGYRPLNDMINVDTIEK